MVTEHNPVIEDLDPVVLMELQMAFGMLVQNHPSLVKLVNNTAPVLFATMLFTACEDYQISTDGEEVTPTRSHIEAAESAIALIRSVEAAFGKPTGEITVDPSEGEIDQDTDISPV